jgi:acetolactate synthase-1/2/3 large subunit
MGAARPSKALFGSDLMVDVLNELGIKYIALNPGASYRGLHDSIVNYGEGKPEMLMCAHEEFAVAMANGYARVTGKPMATGLHNVVGLQHAAMAIFNAWCDRTPMLNLGGGGPQDANHRRSTDWVHTALVQGALVRDFVKYDDQPNSVEAASESLLRGYRIATTQPTGPVYICLDTDVQEQRLETTMSVPNVKLFAAPAPPRPNLEALREAASMLAEAEWPVIISGEIGRDAEALPSMVEIAELLGAPVIEVDGRYSISNAHPLDVTPLREEVLAQADVVLALDVPSLGVPLGPSVRERGALQPAIKPDCKVIHITLRDQEKQSWVSDNMWLMPVILPIAADTTQALHELLIMCRELRAMGEDYTRKVEERRAKVTVMHDAARVKAEAAIKAEWDSVPIAGGRLFSELRDRVRGRDWALVHEHGRRWRDVLEVTEVAHGLGGGRGGGVGYGLPSSIGAALAYKGTGRLVVSILGDGDFFMTSNALWTAAKYEIPLLVIIYNNRSYYNDEDHQERMAVARDRPVENKGIGIRIEGPAPDFAALARSIGVQAFGPVASPGDLGAVLDDAIKIVDSGKPVVVDVLTQAR